MPQAVPFQLWMDLAPIQSAIGVAGTVTVTTTSSHGITPGAYVQIDGLTGPGTAFNTVAQVAATPSGTTFTYVLGAVSGTATVDTGVISYDLLNPPINYTAGTARQHALIAAPGDLQLSSNGDGSGSSMSLTILQETTPAVGPWFSLIPDNTRFRLTQKDTGSVPGTADVRFLGLLSTLDSELTGSGQGTFSRVTLGDVNVLLDRLGVFGQNTSTRTLKASSATRASNVTTLTFPANHGFAAGQQIKVSGFNGGGTGSFNGIFTISTVPTTRTLTYANTGTSCTSGGRTDNINFTTFTVARKGNATDRLRLTSTGATGSQANYFNLASGDTIFVRGISGVGGSGWTAGNLTKLGQLANGTFSGSQVIVINAYTIELVLPQPITGNWGTFQTGAYLIGIAPQAGPPIVNGQMIVKIAQGATEDSAVTTFLALTNAYKSTDYPLQRLFNTAGTAQITGGTTYRNNQEVQFGATTLRSALDAIIETYSGNDVKARRTFIDVNGNLNYKLVDAASTPTYATAPYAIVTSSAGTPNTSTGKATVAPFSLTVTWDHETAKAAMFTIPATSGATLTQVWAYTDLTNDSTGGSATFTERKGAPTLDAVVDFPTAVTNPGAQMQRAAAAYFLERHKPLLSGSFELRGAGTAAWNQYGFGSGYAQTGVSTFGLVTGWQPGQWVEVTSAGLGLSGLYRVEQVEWGLEPGSYIQRIRVTFNRKNPTDLAAIVAGQKR